MMQSKNLFDWADQIENQIACAESVDYPLIRGADCKMIAIGTEEAKRLVFDLRYAAKCIKHDRETE